MRALHDKTLMTPHDPVSSHLASGDSPATKVIDHPDGGPAAAPGSGAVKRRLVFYISGYDPRGAGWYHGIYAHEAVKQSAINGMSMETGSRHRVGALASRWAIRGQDAGGITEVQYDFLHWDDIVRETWARTLPDVLFQTLRGTWLIFYHGGLRRLYRMSWPFAVTATWPLLYIAGAVAGALAAAALVWALSALLLKTSLWIAAPSALAAAFLAGRYMLAKAARANGFWIGRLLAVIIDMALDRRPEISARTAAFAGHIRETCARAAALPGGVDEVLVIAHSTGGEIAVRTMARLLEADPALAASGKLAFLTLGQMIACESMPQGKGRFRADLLAVATAPALHWLDVGFPGDPACIALVDPVEASDMTRPPGAPLSPKMLSPRFNKLFTPQTYARLRKQKMDLHFMYLHASELPGDYDYFAITAGSRKLEERFAHLESIRDFDRLKRGILRGRV